MKLANEQQLQNTLSKLAGLEELIGKKQQDPRAAPAREASLESLTRLAGKLRREVEQYTAAAASRA